MPKRSFVINFYCHICVLLVKAISMIYICYIKYIMNAACVFAVGDNELGVGDDEDASSEAAEGHGRRRGRVVGGCRGTWHTHEDWKITWLVLDLSCGMVSVAASQPSLREGPSTCWGCARQEISLAHLSSSYSCSTHENKSNDIYMLYKIWRK